MHVLAQGRINPGGCSYATLQGWLVTIPAKLGMERISRGRAWIDLFTYRALPVEVALAEIEALNVTVEQVTILERGLETLASEPAPLAPPGDAGIGG